MLVGNHTLRTKRLIEKEVSFVVIGHGVGERRNLMKAVKRYRLPVIG